MRKFEKISFKQFAKDIDDGNYSEIVLPYRKTKHSAGYDFISFLDITLSSLANTQITVPDKTIRTISIN